MSAMLGRSGTWYYGYPCGATSRIMRRSGRQREARQLDLEIQVELEPDWDELLMLDCCRAGRCGNTGPWGDPWPFD